jgi:hypothetical protein
MAPKARKAKAPKVPEQRKTTLRHALHAVLHRSGCAMTRDDAFRDAFGWCGEYTVKGHVPLEPEFSKGDAGTMLKRMTQDKTSAHGMAATVGEDDEGRFYLLGAPLAFCFRRGATRATLARAHSATRAISAWVTRQLAARVS